MTRHAFLILLLAATLAACSSDPKNNDANGTPNNTADVGNNTFVDVDNSGANYAMGYEVIFDSIAFSTQPVNQLNQLLTANLDQNLDFPIIILLSITDIDPEAGTLVIEGGSGLKTEEQGTFVFDPESDLNGTTGTLDSESGEYFADLDFFAFVATFVFENDISKTILPINELELAGQLDLQDGGATAGVANGTLSGYMTKEDGDATEITLSPGGAPITLTQVFKENTLNYDTATGMMVDAGTGDAWFVGGTYTAIPTTINN